MTVAGEPLATVLPVPAKDEKPKAAAPPRYNHMAKVVRL